MFKFIRKLIEDRRVRQGQKRKRKVLEHMLATRDGSPDYEIAHLSGYRLGSAKYETFVAGLVDRDFIRLHQKGEKIRDQVLTIPKYFLTRTGYSAADGDTNYL